MRNPNNPKKPYPEVGDIWQYFDGVPRLVVNIYVSKEKNTHVVLLKGLGHNKHGEDYPDLEETISSMRALPGWKKIA